jgi:hypothetical protein
MLAVWVVVVVLGVGVAAAAVASRRQADDVEPSVREFTEFRDAISRQVAGVQADTRSTRRHLDRQVVGRKVSSVDDRSGEHRSQS